MEGPALRTVILTEMEVPNLEQEQVTNPDKTPIEVVQVHAPIMEIIVLLLNLEANLQLDQMAIGKPIQTEDLAIAEAIPIRIEAAAIEIAPALLQIVEAAVKEIIPIQILVPDLEAMLRVQIGVVHKTDPLLEQEAAAPPRAERTALLGNRLADKVIRALTKATHHLVKAQVVAPLILQEAEPRVQAEVLALVGPAQQEVVPAPAAVLVPEVVLHAVVQEVQDDRKNLKNLQNEKISHTPNSRRCFKHLCPNH